MELLLFILEALQVKNKGNLHRHSLIHIPRAIYCASLARYARLSHHVNLKQLVRPKCKSKGIYQA